MAARAMWKGVIRIDDAGVPVKLYSAVEDRSVHFRLVHRKDRVPVRQAMVNPQTDQVLDFGATRRAYVTGEGSLVVLSGDELSALDPEPSRDIRVLQFLPPRAIDHRWYQRPYYLGPDGEPGAYSALTAVLEQSGREALVRWVMRDKEYMGALRLHQGYPMLVSLRHSEEVMSVDELEAPGGPGLDSKELSMARQLVSMLEAPFEPEAYHDEYRERVLDLIETKKRGKSKKVVPMRKPRPSKDLSRALEASLKQEREQESA